jgi:hypothetical protein
MFQEIACSLLRHVWPVFGMRSTPAIDTQPLIFVGVTSAAADADATATIAAATTPTPIIRR